MEKMGAWEALAYAKLIRCNITCSSFLTKISKFNSANKLTMAKVGALDDLSKYPSLGPQDVVEEAVIG